MEGISWDTYQRMLADIGEGRTRLTYDEGTLEVMSPSPFHEKLKKLIGRLLEAYADAIEIELEGFGSMTRAREDLKKGLEPDECYYAQNAPAVMGRDDIDLTVDPPPDLAIEVEVSRSSVSRQPIDFALGVGEVWVFRAGNRSPCSARRIVRARDGEQVLSRPAARPVLRIRRHRPAAESIGSFQGPARVGASPAAEVDGSLARPAPAAS